MAKKEINPVVIALNNGLANLAEPLICQDLIGKYSVFGELAKKPRPLFGCNDYFKKNNQSDNYSLAEVDGLVLWHSGHSGDNSIYEVDETVYIAGSGVSSFDIAFLLANNNFFNDWSSVILSTQTSGRGQLRRNWVSPRGNLYASIRLPNVFMFQHKSAAIVVAGIVASFLNKLGLDVKIKWPNDILVNNRKIAGVLIEERNNVVVAGVGINILSYPPDDALREGFAAYATCLKEFIAVDSSNSPFFMLNKLIKEFKESFKLFCELKDQSKILQSLNNYAAWKGQQVLLDEDGSCIAKGLFLGFGTEGGVLISNKNGMLQEFFSGSLRLDPCYVHE